MKELTDKQKRVQQLLDAGYGTRRIARILQITRTSVHDHQDAIIRKHEHQLAQHQEEQP